jgi:hypothetical protein
MLRRAAPPVLIALAIAGCGSTMTKSDTPSESASAASPTTATTRAQPKTLEAATAAVQEWADRRSSEDYAGAWQLFNKQVQDGMTEADYVTLSETCTSALTKYPETAKGVRMDGPDKAFVRLEALGFKISVDVLYEDGQWVLAPEPEFAKDLNKPIQQLIAERKARGDCEVS